MIKRLLFSAMAVSAMAFSANADTLDMLPSIGNGWGTSYDAATKTITFEGEWKGCGWWLDGADYSKYDEMVVEFVENAQTVQLVIEYAENDNESVQAAAGKTKVVAPLNAEKKNSIRQIYLQLPAAGTLTLTAAYMQNAAAFDPTAPVVLVDKAQELKGWNNFKIPASDFAAAKLVAGDKLEVAYTSTDGNGFKICDPSTGWPTMPFIQKTEGYNETYGTIYLPIDKNSISFTLEQEDVDICLAQGVIFQGDGVNVEKVTLIRAAAGAGIADIATDENAPVEYFNLQGVRIAEPAAGQIVIRRQGTNVSKVYVK